MTIFRGEELIFRRERCCETVATELDAAALGPGQLLVEARYTLVSQGTELANFTGLDPGTRQPGSWNCYPHRPGYASAGTVVATGPAVGREPRFEPGDQVLAITPHARYGVADPAIRPVTGLRADDDQRTLILARMAAVAMTAVRKAGSVDLGGRAVVVGLGLVGFFAAQLLRLGGMEVLGVEAAAVRREAAIAAGVRADPPDPVDQVRVHRTERAGDPDLVIEATGSDAGLRLALDLVRDGGEVRSAASVTAAVVPAVTAAAPASTADEPWRGIFRAPLVTTGGSCVASSVDHRMDVWVAHRTRRDAGAHLPRGQDHTLPDLGSVFESAGLRSGRGILWSTAEMSRPLLEESYVGGA